MAEGFKFWMGARLADVAFAAGFFVLAILAVAFVSMLPWVVYQVNRIWYWATGRRPWNGPKGHP